MCREERICRESIGNGQSLELHNDPRSVWINSASLRIELILSPCSRREVPSGMYLTRTLLRRNRRKPYKGDSSVYAATASLRSATPPFPVFRSSTSSLVVYLRRSLCEGSKVSLVRWPRHFPRSDGSLARPLRRHSFRHSERGRTPNDSPSSVLGSSSLKGFSDGRVVQAIQRHRPKPAHPNSQVCTTHLLVEVESDCDDQRRCRCIRGLVACCQT